MSRSRRRSDEVRLVAFDYEHPPDDPAIRQARRKSWPVLIVVALVAGGVGWALLRAEPSSPVTAAERLVEAANAGEVTRAVGGLHPEAGGLTWTGPLDLDDMTLDDRAGFSGALDFFAEVGGTIAVSECAESSESRLGGEAECRFVSTDELSRIVGAPPREGRLVVGLEAGRIRTLDVNVTTPEPSWTVFETWVGSRSPEAFERWLATEVEYSSNGVPLSWRPARVYTGESGAALLGLARGYAAEDLRPPTPLVASDGMEWSRSVDGLPALYGSRLTTFSDRFAVLSRARVWLSDDGQTWVDGGPPPGETERIQGAADRLLAVGSNLYEVWQSADGSTWTQVDLDNPERIPLRVGDIAVGGDTVLITSGHRAWIGDGVDFRPAAFPYTLGPWGCYGVGPPYAVAGTETGFVVVPVGEQTDRIDIWTSSDGEGWTLTGNAAAFGPDAIVCDVVGSNGRFVAVGSAIWTSGDGNDWTVVAEPGAGLLTGIEVGTSGWAASGDEEAGVWTSPGGADWQQVAEQVTSTVRTPVILAGADTFLLADVAPSTATAWIGRVAGS